MIPNAGGLGFGSPAKPRARYRHDSQKTGACILPSYVWRSRCQLILREPSPATAFGGVLMAATAFAGQRGMLHEVQGSAATVEAGMPITFTARGSNPAAPSTSRSATARSSPTRSASCRPQLSMYLPSQAPIVSWHAGWAMRRRGVRSRAGARGLLPPTPPAGARAKSQTPPKAAWAWIVMVTVS